MVHIHNEILLSFEMEHVLASSNEVDETGTYFTEWTKSEWEGQVLHINTFIRNLGKQYLLSYKQSRNGDAHVKNIAFFFTLQKKKW